MTPQAEYDMMDMAISNLQDEVNYWRYLAVYWNSYALFGGIPTEEMMSNARYELEKGRP